MTRPTQQAAPEPSPRERAQRVLDFEQLMHWDRHQTLIGRLEAEAVLTEVIVRMVEDGLLDKSVLEAWSDTDW